MEEKTYSLFDVSQRLGVSPSGIKKRVVGLNVPVKRGARGKLLFDTSAFALLSQADALLKAGADFETCRRELGLDRALEAPATALPASLTKAPSGAAVYIKLRPRKPASSAGGDLLKRIDTAFALIAQKDQQTQALHDKLLGAYEEITRLSATSAAFQERAANLGHDLEVLQAEMKLLAAPAPRRPWWKLWGGFN